MNCLSDSVLDRYHAGELDQGAAKSVEEHLHGCTDCRRRDADLIGSHDDLINRIKSWKLSPEEFASSFAALPAIPPDVALDAGAPMPPAIEFEGYEIVKTLYHGGQGVVYQALQRSTKRKVAIKVLLEGPHASPSARKRFEREIELIANLKHPNIVAVFDSGVTKDGRQYCVMDYIRGLRLNEYIHEKRPSVKALLQLFATLCESVNYAHQRGIIHRDLKPSNILVDVDGNVKILDFGLAKQLSGGNEPSLSITGEVVGTLPYLAPEQARGRPDEIDIRTDVYALGVVLFECLTGRYPYPVVGEMADVLRHITETEPDKPSRVWKADSGITTKDAGSIPRLGACPLDNEVETIILKALSKERERRYQSALDLARDLKNYLSDRPIEAKRDSSWYVFKKNVRRYKLAVGVAAVFVLVLAGSAITLAIMYRAATASWQESMTQAAIAQEQRDRALDAEAASVTVQQYLENMLTSISPERALGRDTTLLREVLDDAAKRITGELAEQPKIAARLHSVVGLTYSSLSIYDEAEKHLTLAYEIALESFGFENIETLTAANNLAILLQNRGRLEEAADLMRRTLETSRSLHGEDSQFALKCMGSLSVILKSQNKLDEAERLLNQAFEIAQRLYGENHVQTIFVLSNMATLRDSQGDLKEAERLYRRVLKGFTDLLGEEHPETLTAEANLATVLSTQSRLEDAEPLLRHNLEVETRIMGPDHASTLTAKNNLGDLLHQQGKGKEAEVLLRETLDGRLKLLGEEHTHTLITMSNLSVCLQRQGKTEEAEKLVRRSVEILTRLRGPGHLNTLIAMNNLSTLVNSQGKIEEAAEIQEKIVEACTASVGENHWTTAVFRLNYADTLRSLKQFGQSEARLLQSRASLEKTLGPDHQHTRTAAMMLVKLYNDWQKPEQAAEWQAKTGEEQTKAPEGETSSHSENGSTKNDSTEGDSNEGDSN